jgi:hypothetical protein
MRRYLFRQTVQPARAHLSASKLFFTPSAAPPLLTYPAVMSAGMKHFGWSPDETIIQVSAMGPFAINYGNPDDDPRNAKK